MAKKSYICAKTNTQKSNTLGLAVPNGNARGCLCHDRDTYSRDCCRRYHMNQGIGNIDYVPQDIPFRAFSNAFSKAFA